jgi:uncharacterized membrane protein YqgA involved in biofilm formation
MTILAVRVGSLIGWQIERTNSMRMDDGYTTQLSLAHMGIGRRRRAQAERNEAISLSIRYLITSPLLALSELRGPIA